MPGEGVMPIGAWHRGGGVGCGGSRLCLGGLGWEEHRAFPAHPFSPSSCNAGLGK